MKEETIKEIENETEKETVQNTGIESKNIENSENEKNFSAQKNKHKGSDTQKELKMKKKKEHSTSRNIRWDKLDNTANLFPVIAGESMTNVYRISLTLSEQINPELLQEALDIVLPKFDLFNVRLRTGVFWYYFEENGKKAPRVTEENTYPCRFIKIGRASCRERV